MNKIQRKLLILTYDKAKLHKKARQIKKSFQEICKLLDGTGTKH